MLGFFYGDIMGLEGASGLHSDQPCVGKGDEFNKAVQAPPVPPQAPAAPAPAAGGNGASPASPADEPPTPPAGKGTEAGAGDPAPGEGAVPPPAASKPGRRSRSL